VILEYEENTSPLKKSSHSRSTGSIGQSTLSIVEQFPDRYSVAAPGRGHNIDEAFAQAVRLASASRLDGHRRVGRRAFRKLRKAGVTASKSRTELKAPSHAATLPEADFVVSAIVGVAGLEATHAAILSGKPIGLANKECMVAAGENPQPRPPVSATFPSAIDSEHNAVSQMV